jgi:uncharacterized protein YdaU (DUF1376 family)
MRDTAHLTLAEHGAYSVMLDHYYATGKPLPADVDALIRLCRAYDDTEKKAVATIADAFFAVNGDGLRHNRRADKELERCGEVSVKRRDAAAKRWHNNGDANADANALQKDTHTTYHIPHTTSTARTTGDSGEDSSEPQAASEPEAPPFILIPIVGDDEGFPIQEATIAEFESLYPAVDVRQTLREIRGWNLANKSRRKTARGVMRHVNSWMTKEQNGGKR